MTTGDDKKLRDLQSQIDALKQKTAPVQESAGAKSMSVGLKAGTELVGPIIGSALLGYALDRWLDTKPWLLIVMLVLGVASGFLNVWKTTQNAGSAVGFKNMSGSEKKSLANGDDPLK